MSLKDRISQGIDRAVKATESAIDEGKLRLAAYQARQRADKEAEALGYALARGRRDGAEPDSAALQVLVDAVNAADAEADALERRSQTAGDSPRADAASGESASGAA